MFHLLIATPSHSLHGGVERIIESLARGLPAHGIRVTVGLAKGARWHQPDRFREEYPGLETVDIDGVSGTRAGRLRGLRAVLDRTRPDVVLIARLFDAYEAVCERKMQGDPLRLAVTVDAYEPEYIADLVAYEGFVDCCRTSGELIAAAVRRFTRIPPETVVSVPGGVRPSHRLVEPRPGAPLRLGYVGRLEQTQKRVLDIVETLVRLREMGVPFVCRIVGTGPVEADLRRCLQDRALTGSVTLEGWKSPEDLYGEIYPNLDVFLHFAEWEGITIAPREAMAHGAVPVVSRFLGLRTEGHFRDGENALTFAVGDTRGAAEQVARLSGDPALWSRLSSAARCSEERRWSEEGALTAWSEVLRRSMDRPVALSGKRPGLQFPESGRLARWFGETTADRLRRFLRRRAPAATPGAEWPHWSGLADARMLSDIREFARLRECP